MRALAAFLALSLAAVATGQRPVTGALRGGVTYVEASSLSVALGHVVIADGGTLTWRGGEGVATFFAGSADALLQRPGDGGPSEWALSAPVELERGAARAAPAPAGSLLPLDPAQLLAAAADDAPGAGPGPAGWLLPLDAVQLLGVAAEERPGGAVLIGPGGEELVVAVPAPPAVSGGGSDWEPVALGAASGLRFFAADQSLLLLDLDLLPLAYPDAMTAVDEAAARAGSDNALLLVAASLSPTELDTTISFAQDGRELTVRAPYRVHVFR